MAAAILTRDEWGARPPRQRPRIPGPVLGTAIHWEGPKMGAYPAAKAPSLVRGIQAFHMDGRKWADIAYSGLVDRFGVGYLGRGPGVRTAAQGSNAGNDRYYAVCVLMGEGDPFTDEAKAGVLAMVALLRQAGGAGGAGADLQPHSKFRPTACPGDDVRAWLAAGAPHPGGSPVPVPPQPSEDDMAPLTPSWAKRLPNGRVPFYRVLPGAKPSEATVLAYNGAPLVRRDGEAFGIPIMRLSKLAGTAVGLVEVEDTGAVLVACEDGGTIDVAARP